MSDSDRIGALEAAVATLRAEVLDARRPRLRSMRDTAPDETPVSDTPPYR